MNSQTVVNRFGVNTAVLPAWIVRTSCWWQPYRVKLSFQIMITQQIIKGKNAFKIRP